VSIGLDLPRCRRVRRSGRYGLHDDEVLIQQLAGQAGAVLPVPSTPTASSCPCRLSQLSTSR
jgi:hypothetical protein